MPIVMLSLPETQNTCDDRACKCPYCGGHSIQKWGRSYRNSSYTNGQVDTIQRYRCGDCSGTFRVYPGIMGRSSQSNLIRRIAAIAWSVGMSLREVVATFEGSGFELSHTTVWREGKKIFKQIEQQVADSPGQKYVIDINFVPRYSNGLGVVLAVDIGKRKPIVLGTVNEHDPRIVRNWVDSLVQESDIKVSILGTEPFLNRLESHFDGIAPAYSQ